MLTCKIINKDQFVTMIENVMAQKMTLYADEADFFKLYSEKSILYISVTDLKENDPIVCSNYDEDFKICIIEGPEDQISIDILEEANSKIPTEETAITIIPKPFTRIHYFINQSDRYNLV